MKFKKIDDLYRSIFSFGSATLLSRILGLGRELVFAYLFGSGVYADAFVVAYRIPNLLRDLLAEGAFSAAFIPVFIESKNGEKNEAYKVFLNTFFAILGLVGFVVILLLIFSPLIVKWFAPSFVNEPEKFNMCVAMTRIMSPFLLIVSFGTLNPKIAQSQFLASLPFYHLNHL